MPSMIGHLSPIPHEPPISAPRVSAALVLAGFAFLAFFAALAVLDSGRNTWGLGLLGVFVVLVAAAAALVRKKKR
jgi:hypothetical protein